MVMCPDCSLVGYLVEQVRRKVRSVVGSSPVEVILLDETWSWSDAAPHLIWGDGI
jgi:metal-sulfur cluster biosynthetic enzyme